MGGNLWARYSSVDSVAYIKINDIGVHLTVAIARLLAGHVGPQGGGLRHVVLLPHATVVYQVIIHVSCHLVHKINILN